MSDRPARQPEVGGEPGAAGAPTGERSPVIEVKNLTKRYGGNVVLDDVSLSFAEGTTTVILGGSGSGKTVFMKHLIGLNKPDSGQVLIDGQDLVPMGQNELDVLRRKFGMVFQGAALFDSMTVGENCAFPLREHEKLPEAEIRRRVDERLAQVGLEGAAAKFPAELSGGMRKRVGLARALMLDPKIVLYDEPTTGLDPITTDSVDEMILEAAKKFKVTSVVISHDIGSAFKVANQLAVLYKGKFVATGPPEEVRASEHPFVKKFLALWFGK